jgi:hypothetical protein
MRGLQDPGGRRYDFASSSSSLTRRAQAGGLPPLCSLDRPVVTGFAHGFPVGPRPEQLAVAAMRHLVVDDGRGCAAAGAARVHLEEGFALAIPSAVIAARTSRGSTRIVTGLALLIAASLARAALATGDLQATAADAGCATGHSSLRVIRCSLGPIEPPHEPPKGRAGGHRTFPLLAGLHQPQENARPKQVRRRAARGRGREGPGPR